MAIDAKERWQVRAAPWLAAGIVAVALFFAAVSISRFDALSARLDPPRPVARMVWTSERLHPNSWAEQVALVELQSRLDLEHETLARRYSNVATGYAASLWTRFMGFTTGMILALLGAAFVLSRIDAPQSELGATSGHIGLTLRSASPGLWLTTLGTVLMALALLARATGEARDKAVYLGGDAAAADLSLTPPVLSPDDSEAMKRPTGAKLGKDVE